MQSKQFVYNIFFFVAVRAAKNNWTTKSTNSNLGDAKLQKIAQKLQQKNAGKSAQNYRNAYNR